MEVVRISSALLLFLGWFFFKETAKKSNKDEEEKQNKIVTCPTISFNAGYGTVTDDIHANSSSGTYYDIKELCNDVMMDTLRRLPPETLIKCKSVSREWRHMIFEVCSYMIPRDGYPMAGLIFCKKGFIAYPPQCDMFYCHGPPLPAHLHDPCLALNANHLRAEDGEQTVAKSFTEPLPMPSHAHDNRELLDCCNGLLLFREYSMTHIDTTPPRYIVCNPTTGECAVIPGKTTYTHSAMGALAFDPHESIHYKVVLIIPDLSQLKIFSSETGRWTKLKFHLKDKTLLKARWSQSVYFHGALYKRSITGHLLRIFINRPSQLHPQVISKSDRVQSIELPLVRFAVVRSFVRECIGIQNGRLRYALLTGTELRIFMLEHDDDDGDSGRDSLNMNKLYWSFNHILSKLPLDSHYHYMWANIYAFHPHLDIVFLGYKQPGQHFNIPKNITICCVNFKSKMVEGRTVLDSKLTGHDDFFVFPFTRCFLPLARCRGNVDISSMLLL